MVSRRRQLIDMRVQETLRLGTTASKAMLKSLNAHIAWLDKRIAEIDTDLTQRLRTSDVWRTKDDLLRGIPGVGVVTTLTMLAKCPELGQLNRREIAPPWRALPLWPKIAGNIAASASYGAVAPMCARSCTWRPFPLCA